MRYIRGHINPRDHITTFLVEKIPERKAYPTTTGLDSDVIMITECHSSSGCSAYGHLLFNGLRSFAWCLLSMTSINT